MEELKTPLIHYATRGQGTALMLVHGFPLNHTIWNETAALLEDQARVILPDLPGHGQSPVVEPVSMDSMADGLAAILDALGIEKVVLAGQSMGGYVCLAFARRYPQRLAGLGLVCTQAAADSPEKRQARLAQAEQTLAEGSQRVAESMAAVLTNRPEMAEGLKHLMSTTPAAGMAAAMRAMAERTEMSAFLPQISVPALVIAGLADAIIPVERAREMAASLPDARLVELEGVGHSPMMEAPQATAEALLGLLKRAQGA
ncbi:alpha/beta fold hydrolase [Levilinea saccharolytica]|uniref:Predicted hydrolase n=1 Tax=Levilinea saccharolytica TaxID=229921 RepID=A0A0M8JPQ6_9CHLR|nr:alpha/beta hydrolase [Levilinea saccharolytica]KPL76221.1 hypothetical protein ADN01_16860 [Levilinea saccharolytica]GAP19012.1 predicted hydrolase [Levilinea saccharolytica]